MSAIQMLQGLIWVSVWWRPQVRALVFENGERNLSNVVRVTSLILRRFWSEINSKICKNNQTKRRNQMNRIKTWGVVATAAATLAFTGCDPDKCTITLPVSAIEKAIGGVNHKF